MLPVYCHRYVVCVTFCLFFSLPLGVNSWLRILIAALPGPFVEFSLF